MKVRCRWDLKEDSWEQSPLLLRPIKDPLLHQTPPEAPSASTLPTTAPARELRRRRCGTAVPWDSQLLTLGSGQNPPLVGQEADLSREWETRNKGSLKGGRQACTCRWLHPAAATESSRPIEFLYQDPCVAGPVLFIVLVWSQLRCRI